MDYVVAGFGIGAILALVGFALWELFGNVEEPGTGWQSRAAIGLMLGALVIWAVTGVSVISHIEDSMGSQLVMLTTLVALIAIAAGTFWYWRADRALAASKPRPAAASAQRAEAAPDTTAGEDFELTDWDSWPERESGKPVATPEKAPDSKLPVQFEAEVAVATETVAPEPDSLDAEVGADVETEPESAAVQPPDPSSVDVGPALALPANVRPFRVPEPAGSADPVVVDDVLIAETIDAQIAEGPSESGPSTVVVEEIAVEVETDVEQADSQSTEAGEPSPTAANGSVAPDSFESALLADIDGSLVDEDGGYRSPLLSDLGSDQLKGVGLAKWRPEARLTEQDQEGVIPPAKSGKRR